MQDEPRIIRQENWKSIAENPRAQPSSTLKGFGQQAYSAMSKLTDGNKYLQGAGIKVIHGARQSQDGISEE